MKETVQINHHDINLLHSQANCEWGRDTIESWGRRRRNAEAERSDEDMNISQEILVLDLGDDDSKLSHRHSASLPVNFNPNSTSLIQLRKWKKNKY